MKIELDSRSDLVQEPELSPRTKLRLTQPQQNTFVFDKVTFSSKFDSGNMARCVQVSKSQYNIYMSEDSLPYTNQGHYRTWFYFSVTGVPRGETLTLSIRNMNNQGKLYKSGLKPVYRILPTHQKVWKRVSNDVTYDYGNEGFYVTFNFQFNCEPTETAYFAFTYPYSFDESLKKSESLMERFKNHESIYFQREVLCHSIEGRPMELLTLTGYEKVNKSQREDIIDGLFPDHEGDKSYRPYKFDKPTVFITSRVHPGETPASYVLTGILNFLTSEKSEQAKVLRENFVFKIIPMLNPDGVYRGYYRLDTKNQNLNRYYSDPTVEGQPTILGAKLAIMQQENENKLFTYVDLHAHANKKGCFMFGNALTGESQLQNMLLPKLISMNSLNFDFVECSFSEKMMNCKDKKDGLSREGCGRVAMYKATGLPLCYTLECNYATGRRINHLAPKLNKITNEIEPELPITDSHSKFYAEYKTPPYTIEVFEDCGRAFCIGLLDYVEKNPISRIPTSTFKCLENIKNDLIAHHPIFLPKKRVEILSVQQNSSKPLMRSQTQKKGQVKPPVTNTKGQPIVNKKQQQINDQPEKENINRSNDIETNDQTSNHQFKSVDSRDKFLSDIQSQSSSKSQRPIQQAKFVRNVSEKRNLIGKTLSERRNNARNQSVNIINQDSKGLPQSINDDENEDLLSEDESIQDNDQNSNKMILSTDLKDLGMQKLRTPLTSKSQSRIGKPFKYQPVKQQYQRFSDISNYTRVKNNDSVLVPAKAAAPITCFRMPTPPDHLQQFSSQKTPQDNIHILSQIKQINLATKLPDILDNLPKKQRVLSSNGRLPRQQQEIKVRQLQSDHVLRDRLKSQNNRQSIYGKKNMLSPKFVSEMVVNQLVRKHNNQKVHLDYSSAAAE